MDLDFISVYTRADAIADGELVEVPADLAREAGFTVPTALTRAAWEDLVRWSHGGCQDETGRLWDVLWMAGSEVRRRRGLGQETSSVDFGLLRVPNRPGRSRALAVSARITVHGGDVGEPVMTISAAGEAL